MSGEGFSINYCNPPYNHVIFEDTYVFALCLYFRFNWKAIAKCASTSQSPNLTLDLMRHRMIWKDIVTNKQSNRVLCSVVFFFVIAIILNHRNSCLNYEHHQFSWVTVIKLESWYILAAFVWEKLESIPIKGTEYLLFLTPRYYSPIKLYMILSALNVCYS